MKLSVIGCNHRTAPLDLRERLAFDPSSARDALAEFARDYADAEAVLLATCNRTELYIARPLHGHPRGDEAAAWLANRCGIPTAKIEGHFYHRADAEAVRHLFRVAGGLDSMVLGESQILGQVRRAAHLAQIGGTAGPALGGLFAWSLRAARAVRMRTGLGCGRFSLGSVAAELAARIFPSFADKTVLMIGAGQIGEITLRHFLARRPQRVWLTSRSDARAGALASRLGAEVRPFERVAEWVAESDVVVTCAASPVPLLTREKLAGLPTQRSHRPMLFVDLGVPRNVEPALRTYPGIHLYDLDDLNAVADQDRQRRRDALLAGERLVESYVAEFVRERARRESAPIVSAFRKHLEDVADREYARLLPKLAAAEAGDPAVFRQLLTQVVNKMLHPPTAALLRLAEEGNAEAYGRMLRKLFDLEAVKETQRIPDQAPSSQSRDVRNRR